MFCRRSYVLYPILNEIVRFAFCKYVYNTARNITFAAIRNVMCFNDGFVACVTNGLLLTNWEL